MSEDIYLRVILSDEEARDRINNLKLKALQAGFEIEKTTYDAEQAEEQGIKAEEQAKLAIELAKEAEVASRRGFHQVMTMMRTSYLLFSGMGRIMGGGMTMMFRTMYMTGMAAVGTYKAIAAAMVGTGPTGWLQASLMMASLVTASIQLTGVLTGQQKLTQQMRGFNMMLHGISGMIGSLDFL